MRGVGDNGVYVYEFHVDRPTDSPTPQCSFSIRTLLCRGHMFVAWQLRVNSNRLEFLGSKCTRLLQPGDEYTLTLVTQTSSLALLVSSGG